MQEDVILKEVISAGVKNKLDALKTQIAQRISPVAALAKVVQFFRWICKFFARLIVAIPTIAAIMSSFLYITVIIAIIVIIIILILRSNPRIPLVTRATALERHTANIVDDMKQALQLLGGANASEADGSWLLSQPRFARLHRNLTRAILALMPDPSTGTFAPFENDPFGGDAETALFAYIKFYDSLTKWNCISKSDLRNNMPEINDDDGNPDRSHVFHGVVDPVNKVQSAILDLSKALQHTGDLAKAIFGANNAPDSDASRKAIERFTPPMVRFATLVHELRVLFELRPSLTLMFKTRRTMPTALWSVHYWPLAKNMITQRIPGYWLKFPRRYVKVSKDAFDWWGGIGVKIMHMPCNLAFSDPVERAKNCRNATKESFNLYNALVDDDDDEVKEGFFGGILSALKAIKDFILNFAALGKAVAKLFINFPRDPVGTIIGFFTIIFGVHLAIFLYLVWFVLTFSGAAFVLIFIFANIVTIGGGILYTLGLVHIAILMAIPYFGLWLIDLPTKGFVSRLMRCENDPDAWYRLPGSGSDNGFLYGGAFCLRPCMSRYTPSFTGCCCNKLPAYMPDFCPQQQAYRIYKDGNTSSASLANDPYVFVDYTPESGFRISQIASKRRKIEKAFDLKMSWYQKCYASMNKYDFLNRHLCDNVDRLGLSSDATTKLATVCKECYCDHAFASIKTGLAAYMTGNARTGNFQTNAPGKGNRAACARIDSLLDQSGSTPYVPDIGNVGGGPGGVLLRITLFIAAVTLCTLIVVISMSEYNRTNSIFNATV